METEIPPNTNPLVTPLLTDMYQISMCYGYWKNQIHEKNAVFDLFFRKNPFKGEYTIFAGLEEVLRLVAHFRFSESDIAYLKTVLPNAEQDFFKYLASVDCSRIKIYALREGTLCFPRIPLLRVEGPLAIAQLLETPLLNLINYPSLICTNAARMRLAAGDDKVMMEFGCRRAQGPDGAISAARYAVMGGFDRTSNVEAGKLFGIGVSGTHAHAFVMSFNSLADLVHLRTLKSADGAREVDMVEMVTQRRRQLGFTDTNEGELAAFAAYAMAFPGTFLALVDTYDTLKSGLQNFLIVATILAELGYQPLGIRLDSGDLAYLSKECRRRIHETALSAHLPILDRATIVASNDLNEATIYSLKEQGHAIDTFGIGTNLVTCQNDPALGCVYKLVEIDGAARIKMSEDIVKVTIPCRKIAYRLLDPSGRPILDLMSRVAGSEEDVPQPDRRILSRHPFEENKRAYVVPHTVVPLHHLFWDGQIRQPLPTLPEIRAYVMQQLKAVRPDHLRAVNPTPYKVSVTNDLYSYIHRIWLSEAPIPTLQ
ncbi:putative Nicotinate phosphoribosyltransferase 2 [Paratrimastix pyriformis]|uniref:Nicotinate phosphoribosyltransferase n=1 Tax=Paratrimastix pyriformis TaxID=342808 RepID=A0ABQ8UV92_9EUKA|nr:putative Nicotinate phosphoribosyltransferase 2 [Paratrimastix pyriformis]